jgi:uncharacterized protein YggU (UPF0235/DUF167 family)
MYIRVAVYPGTKRETVEKLGENRFEIKVKEPAERNLANARVKELLAVEYGVEVKTVRLVSGHQNSRKIFALPDPLTK